MNPVRSVIAGVTLAAAPFIAIPLAAQNVRVTVARSSESTPTKTVLLVRVDGTGLVLGSYQGQLHFDPTVFAVDSSVAGRDGSRYVNAADAAHGTIRFAGFTTGGFKNSDAVRIVGRTLKPLTGGKFSAQLDVAGDLDGKTIPKSGLAGATGLAEVK